MSHQSTHDALSSLMSAQDQRHDGAIMSLFEGLQAENMHGELDDMTAMNHGIKMDSASFLDLAQDQHVGDYTGEHAHAHDGQHGHDATHGQYAAAGPEDIPSPLLQGGSAHQHGYDHDTSIDAGATSGVGVGVGVGAGVGVRDHQHQHQHHQHQHHAQIQQQHPHQQQHHQHQAHALTQQQSVEPASPFVRSHSPVNAAIPIPAALQALASSTQPIAVPSYDMTEFAGEQVSDRGEMGGKRKKQPHERAGWKEMDEQGLLKKRATGGRKKVTIDEYVGYDGQAQGQDQGMGHAQALQQHDNGSMADVMQADMYAATGATQQQQQDMSMGVDPMEDGKKISKTEQNRRAQQIYRRRREERMKQLEADAQALERTRKALEENSVATQSLAFDLESAQIEISALRSALQSLRAQGIAVLTHEDTLPIGESRSAMPSTAPKAEQLEEAFNKLAAQSREVAKIRRAN